MENLTTTNETTNRITITELIEGYNKRTSEKLKKDYLLSVIKVKNYIGYSTKTYLAEKIIENSCLKGANIQIDSCKKYIMYIHTLITYYTNIDFPIKDITFNYDLLEENGILENILEIIPEKEIATFKAILDMKLNDLMTNKYEIHSFITELFTNSILKINTKLSPFVQKICSKIETLDEKKIEKAINKAIKILQ